MFDAARRTHLVYDAGGRRGRCCGAMIGKIGGRMRHLAISLFLGVAALAPAMAQDIHIVHCYKGACPSGVPESNDLVVYEIFALSANNTTKLADWVAYRVTSQTIGTSEGLNRDWRTDPFLSETETLEAGRGRQDDYSGAFSAERYDRGHQAPLAAFAGTPFWRVTNIYSNITPQRSDLNQGAWRLLEEAVRDVAYDQNQIWIVTGPVYERDMPGLQNAGEVHAVPSGYWKLITNRAGAASAFFFDQDTPREANFCDHRIALAEVERQARLTLMPAGGLRVGDLDEALGCGPAG